ncbi:MAG TPA: SMC-Scp complex subunit ScpB [Kineosporiaceae bacterium]|nr:SMC-Scp complex subunit ScpB [Kineosporiaceae bacterium]
MSEPTDVGLPGGTASALTVPVPEIDLRDPEPTAPAVPAERPEPGGPDAGAAAAPAVVDLRAAGAGAAAADAGEGASLFDLDAFPRGAQGAVEAVLMVVDEPVAEGTLASALGLTVAQVDQVLAELAADYDEAGRGFELRRVAGGWRIYSRAEYAPVVERFMLDGQTARLTQAALETLAIVAYRQPVSRARVGAVRGVNVDAVMRTLSTRGLVEEAGSDPESGAVLYRTTPYFLHRIGLTSLDDLPALAPYLPEADALDELGAGSAS